MSNNIHRHYQHLIRIQKLDKIKKRIAPLISDDAASGCLAEGAPIDKKGLNVATWYWFGLISCKIMTSQNKSIILLAKTTCLYCIMEEIRINLGTIIISVIPMLAKQRRIYLLFPILINKWCRRVKVPRNAREGVEWLRLYLPISIPSK